MKGVTGSTWSIWQAARAPIRRQSLRFVPLPVKTPIPTCRYSTCGLRTSSLPRLSSHLGSSPSRQVPITILLLGAGGAFIIHTSRRHPLQAEEHESVSKKSPHDLEEQHEYEVQHPNLFYKIVYFINDYVIEPLSTARRFLHLAFLFLPVLFTTPVLLLEYYGSHKDGEGALTVWWFRLLVAQMERAGPTFIKLAQWAGSRRDLFPDSLCDMFGRLHSNGKPHSLKHTKKELAKSFGRPFDELFIEFNEVPMGIGAIAQVYKAVLKPDLLPEGYRGPKHERDSSATGTISRTIAPSPEDKAPPNIPSTELAIKVLHPKVEKTIRRDLLIMQMFANVFNLLPGVNWLSLPEEVQVFGQLMMSQLDLRTEARNLETFERKFRHRRSVSFPRPLIPYTTKHVLVEEYEDAVPLKYFLREGGSPFDESIANIGLDAFLNMLLIDNFVHSDLHPGNIFVKFYKPSTKFLLWSKWASLFDKYEPDPSSVQPADEPMSSTDIAHKLRSLGHDRTAWLQELDRLHDHGYRPELVFIDAGLVTELSDKNLKDFVDLFASVATFDGHRAGRLMVERCRSPEQVIDPDTFALKMQHLILSVKSQTFSLATIRISDVLSEVLNNVRSHHVKLEADFVNTVISILLLEGIGRQLDPGLDLFKSAIPILRKVGMQMNTSAVKGNFDLSTYGNIAKMMIWVEARELASVAVSEVDQMIKTDMLTPSI